MSALWDRWNNLLIFLTKVPIDELRLHVGFLYFLGAPITEDYWRTQNFLNGNTQSAQQLKDDLLKLTYQYDIDSIWSEPDPGRELFSVPINIGDKAPVTKWINSDVLRIQTDISNLINFGILTKRNSSGTPFNIIEVGGGYGHLAAAIVRMFPHVTYTIIDLPLQLSIQSRWLNYLGFQTQDHLPIDSLNRERNLNETRLSTINLITKDMINELLDCDLLINVNSFCEMTTEVVLSYVDKRLIKYEYLYSNNRDIQFMNRDLQLPISQIIAKFNDLYPLPAQYEEGKREFSKKVFCAGNIVNLNKIDLKDIHGITRFKSKYEIN